MRTKIEELTRLEAEIARLADEAEESKLKARDTSLARALIVQHRATLADLTAKNP